MGQYTAGRRLRPKTVSGSANRRWVGHPLKGCRQRQKTSPEPWKLVSQTTGIIIIAAISHSNVRVSAFGFTSHTSGSRIPWKIPGFPIRSKRTRKAKVPGRVHRLVQNSWLSTNSSVAHAWAVKNIDICYKYWVSGFPIHVVTVRH